MGVQAIKFWIIIILLLSKIGLPYTFCQEQTTEQIIENISEQYETELENSEWQEQLDYYKENLLDINHADKEQLIQLGLLTELQINSLLNHIENNGKLINVYELQSVNYFDLETIHQILPYIKTEEKKEQIIPMKELLIIGKNYLFIRTQETVEKSKGYQWIENKSVIDSPAYKGSPYKIYSRFRHYYGTKISYGFTLEKDAGEPIFNKYQKKGFDFYSAHLFIRDINIFRSIAIGDYEVKFGQGLIAYQGFSMGKSSWVTNIKKDGHFLRQYSSSNEFNFMRGIGTTIGFKNILLTTFYSSKKIDAHTSATDSIENVLEISTIYDDGYHRTISELTNRHTILQTVIGSNLTFTKRKFHIGLTTINTQLSTPLIKAYSLYNQFDFSGKNLTNSGVDYNFLIRNFNFFGEFARSDNEGLAILNGVLIALDPKLDLSILHRHFQKNYQSFFAQPFSEGYKPSNEVGTYIGLTIRPLSLWQVDAYFDSYKFPWLKYRVDAPSDGYDAMLQINFKPGKFLGMYGRAKYKTKALNVTNSYEPIYSPQYNKKMNLRYQLNYKISKNVTLQTRWENVIWNDGKISNKDGNQYGYLIFQDIKYDLLGSPLTFSLRYSLFDVDDYDARIYAYEDDVQYSFSVPFFYHQGSRYYLMVHYKLQNNFSLEFRFAQTYYSNANVIGSGNDEIKGNRKSEIKAQLKWMF